MHTSTLAEKHLEIFGFLWLRDVSLRYLFLSPCGLPLWVFLFSVSCRNNHCWIYPHPEWSFLMFLTLITSAKILITNKITFWGSKRAHLWGWGYHSTHYLCYFFKYYLFPNLLFFFGILIKWALDPFILLLKSYSQSYIFYLHGCISIFCVIFSKIYQLYFTIY